MKLFETDRCRDRLIKYCKGWGVDLGCGGVKIKSDAIGVDKNSVENVVDIVCNIASLSLFAKNRFDYVYSSHALEDLEKTESVLREWLKILKINGYLVLYLPDKDYYYNIGDRRANPAHKHDFYWEDVWTILEKIGNTKLIHYQRYGPKEKVGEWSFELVVQRIK